MNTIKYHRYLCIIIKQARLICSMHAKLSSQLSQYYYYDKVFDEESELYSFLNKLSSNYN